MPITNQKEQCRAEVLRAAHLEYLEFEKTVKRTVEGYAKLAPVFQRVAP